MRVLLLGATGTIGRATLGALVEAGHDVVAMTRKPSQLPGATHFVADVKDASAWDLRGLDIDAVVSCMASRTGAPKDAWAIDHDAHLNALNAAKAAGIGQFVLLSALCVQKPERPFQLAKLAFEEALMASGLTWSIVRPTAFFKSLSGQVERVKDGKPFLVFGTGEETACKPISDRDLGRFIASCLTKPERAEATDQPLRLRRVPLWFMDGIVGVLAALGAVSHRARDKAELARIGRYYASNSMLCLDPATGLPDAEGTPEFGADRLFDYYDALLDGHETLERGDHAVF